MQSHLQSTIVGSRKGLLYLPVRRDRFHSELVFRADAFAPQAVIAAFSSKSSQRAVKALAPTGLDVRSNIAMNLTWLMHVLTFQL